MCIAVILVVAISLVSSVQVALPSSTLRGTGNPKSTDSITESQMAPVGTLVKNWNYSTGSEVWSSPALADLNGDGNLEVLIGSDDGKLYCLNAAGKPIWSFRTGAAIESSPAVADIDGDGKLEVITKSGDSHVYCISATGALKWSYSGKTGRSSPAIADINGDGKLEILVASGEGPSGHSLYCLDASGRFQWSYPIGSFLGTVWSSPAVADVNGDGKMEVVVGDCDNITYCVDANGNLKWSYKTGWWVESSPSFADLDGDGKLEVVFGSTDGKVYCLSGTGDLKWYQAFGVPVDSSPIIVDLDMDGEPEVLVDVHWSYPYDVYCLSNTGAVKWKFSTMVQQSSPTVADVDGDQKLEVVIGSYDNELYILDSGGNLKWSYPIPDAVLSSPAIADLNSDGKLEIVFGCFDDNVYCLSVSSAPLNPGVYTWPSIGFRGDLWHTGCFTDSDRDGLTDNYEATVGTNPLSADTDGDTATDYAEFLSSTNPFLPDTVAPSAITNLVASAQTFDSVVLTWTAPGDNGNSGSATGYIVKYSTSGSITEDNWNSATTYSQSWIPKPSGVEEMHVISELRNDTRYWFAVKTYDGTPNYSGISNSLGVATPDAFPPAAIIDLTAGNATDNSVILTWTAPGDNGTLGTAAGYVVKYSTTGPISDANWDSATTLSQSWVPMPVGAKEIHIVTGLNTGTTYWFSVRAYDEVPNRGGVSNSPSVTTTTTILLVAGGGLGVVICVVVTAAIYMRKRR
jgi:hypothetical protein